MVPLVKIVIINLNMEKLSDAPKTTTPTISGGGLNTTEISNKNQTKFLAMALTMGWQLALVVLIPVIGGFELDKKLDLSPIMTVLGFFIAMVGFGLVLWRVMHLADTDYQRKSKSSS